MTDVAGYKPTTKWSECTKARLEEDFLNGFGYCLHNKPETVVDVGGTPVCGNFFVEEGKFCWLNTARNPIIRLVDLWTCLFQQVKQINAVTHHVLPIISHSVGWKWSTCNMIHFQICWKPSFSVNTYIVYAWLSNGFE